MFSKKLWKRLLLITLSFNFLGLSACSRFFNEKRQEPQTLELSNAKFACLRELPVEINKWIKGNVNERGINEGFECMKGALVYFKNKTKGTFDDAYTMEDMRNFFGKYFLKENNVTPEFGVELFKLKKVMLGGSENSITKLEIQRIVEMLDVLKEHSVLVAPYVTTLLGDQEKPEWSQVDKAMAQLEKTLWTLFKHVNMANSEYSFEDFKKFAKGLDNFLNANEKYFLTEKFESNVLLVEALKDILIGEKNHLNNLNDWQTAIHTVMSIYKEVLRYHYFLKGQEFNTAPQMQALLRATREAIEILETSLPMERQGMLTFASIDRLLELLEKRQLLPKGLSAPALKETYKKFVLRMLDPRRQGDSRGLQGVERSHLLALKHELKIFELHQAFIDGLKFDTQGLIGFTDLYQGLKTFDAAGEVVKSFSAETLEQESLVTAWQEGKSLLTQAHPLVFNPQGRLMVVNEPRIYGLTWKSLTKWNLMRATTRALLLGYGSRKSGPLSLELISETGMEQLYADFNLIGLEMKAFDKRSLNAGKRSFKEANFFTATGNGDDWMTFRETFDLVSLLLSGGMSTSEFIRKDMTAKGCEQNNQDEFGFNWLNEACFRKVLRQNMSLYFNNLPGLIQEVSTMSDARWNNFYLNLMAAARLSSSTGGQVETADIRTAVMILHYTETLLAVYDFNRDGKLNMEEVRAAAPRFLSFMKTVSPIGANFVVTDFFLFLVYEGKKPGIIDYGYFQLQKAFSSLEDVSRDKILRVFKVLKDEANKKPKQEVSKK